MAPFNPFKGMPASKSKPPVILAAQPASSAPATVKIAPMRRIPTKAKAEPAPAYPISFRGVSYASTAELHDELVEALMANDNWPMILIGNPLSIRWMHRVFGNNKGYSHAEMLAAVERRRPPAPNFPIRFRGAWYATVAELHDAFAHSTFDDDPELGSRLLANEKGWLCIDYLRHKDLGYSSAEMAAALQRMGIRAKATGRNI